MGTTTSTTTKSDNNGANFVLQDLQGPSCCSSIAHARGEGSQATLRRKRPHSPSRPCWPSRLRISWSVVYKLVSTSSGSPSPSTTLVFSSAKDTSESASKSSTFPPSSFAWTLKSILISPSAHHLVVDVLAVFAARRLRLPRRRTVAMMEMMMTRNRCIRIASIYVATVGSFLSTVLVLGHRVEIPRGVRDMHPKLL